MPRRSANRFRATATPHTMRRAPSTSMADSFQRVSIDRDQLTPGDHIHGPAMITEYTSATVLPPDARAEVDAFGNLAISFEGEHV